MGRWAKVAAVACGLLACPAAAETIRPYSAGPLRAGDFQKGPPAGIPHHAHTSTRLGYGFRYRSRTFNGSSVVVLSEVTLTNNLVQSESWTRRPGDAQLMQHEQGHFDITETVRRRARAYFTKQRMARIKFRASTLDGAVQALEEGMRKEMAPFFARMPLLQRQYDAETQHGTNAAEQARWRKQLDLLLGDPTASIPAPR